MRLGAAVLLVACLCGCPAEPPQGDPPDATAADVSTPDGGGVDMRDTPDDGVDEADSNEMPDEDAAVPDGPTVRPFGGACPGTTNDGGESWDGWANLQFPRVVELTVGETSEPIFGQVWSDGQTDQPGQAPGWEAELLVGPLGVNPADDPGCFRALPAEFNTDVDNNDEHWVRVEPSEPGVYGMYFRYRPPGGAWRIGDANGTDDGVTTAEAGIIAVEAAPPDAIRVVSLNLRCQTDDWAQRFDEVVDALVEIDPHVVGFQEDCAAPGEQPQSFAVAAALSAQSDRGYEEFTLRTHQANYDEGTFDEGISMLTAFPIEAHFHIDLPHENFPRAALVMDVRVGNGDLLRLVNTHLDYGAESADARTESANAIVAELTDSPAIITGDFNATPDSAAYAAMVSAAQDTWVEANGADGGETIPADAPTRRIDYVFVKDWTTSTSETVGEGANLSDHLGVFTTLTP